MRRTAFLLLLVVGAAAAPAGSAATTQCRLCAAGENAAEQADSVPVAIEIETSLDFDRLILTGPAGGTARLGADGSRTTMGSLGEISGRAMAGSVVIRGEPGRLVRVELPTRIGLESWNGSRITIERISSDLSSSPRLDSAGRLSFRFGGELRVDGDSDGDYHGHVPITVEYL